MKPTILDHLTSPTVTPEILRVRASYWNTVAARNERYGRVAQADRIRRNCMALRMQAEAMERDTVVSIVAPGRKAATKKAPGPGAPRFWELHAEAVRSIRARYGGNWKCAAPHGETVLVSLPAGLRSCKGPLGGTIRWGRDHRMPAALYWPDGTIPCDLVTSIDPPRATGGREWGDRRLGGVCNTGYAEWQDAWAKRNGLVKRGGRFFAPSESALIDEADVAREEAA